MIISITFSILRFVRHLVKLSPEFEIFSVEILKLQIKSLCFPVVEKVGGKHLEIFG